MKTAQFHHLNNKHSEMKRKSENVTPKHIKLENLSLTTILYHLWRRFNVQKISTHSLCPERGQKKAGVYWVLLIKDSIEWNKCRLIALKK